MKKRLLASVLSLAMLLTMTPATAFASDMTAEPPEGGVLCVKTDACTLPDGHEGDCVVEGQQDVPETPAEDETPAGTEGLTPAPSTDSIPQIKLTEDGDTPADGTQQNDGEADAVVSVTIGEETKEYSSLQEAMNEAATASKNSKNVEVKLLDDVDLSGEDWEAVAVDAITIDGQGHTIRNLEINKCFYSTGKHGAGFIWNATGKLNIKDITFDQASINTEFGNIIAVVVGYTYGTTVFENVNVTNSEVHGFGKVGTILGMGAQPGVDVTFTDCESTGNTVHAMYDAGGLAGNIQRAKGTGEADVEISGCVVDNEFVQADLPSSGFTNTAELNDSVSCESCSIAGKAISGTYVEDNKYYWPAYAEYYCSYGDSSHDCTLKNGEKKLANSEYMVGPVASVDGEVYLTLADAIDAAGENATVVLEADVAEDVTIPADKTITLDLNGKTLTGTKPMMVDGNLTIEDSTAKNAPEVSGGYETVTYQSGKIAAPVIVENGGSVTLESGTVVSEKNYGIYVNGNQKPESEGDTTLVNSKLMVNGGYIEAREYGVGVAGRGAQVNINDGVIVANDNAAVAGNGTNSTSRYDGGTTINIAGGTMISHIVSSGYIACGVYHPQKGELNISGGTIYADGGVGVLMRGGKLNMTGGDVIATGTASGKVGDSKVVSNCYGIQLDGASNYYDGVNASVEIRGGSVSTTAGVDNLNKTDADQNVFAVSGGTFTHKIDDAFLAPGCALFPNADGTYTVELLSAENAVAQIVGGAYYATLAEAVQAVVDSESKTGTVQMLKNAEGSGIGLFNGKGAQGVNLTIDFNGKSYICNDPAVGSVGTESQGFHLEKGNTVTMQNGTIGVAKGSKKTVMLIQNYCDLTLNNMVLKGADVTEYIISTNYGDSVLNNVSINGTAKNLVALDVMHWLGTTYADKAPTLTIHNGDADAIAGGIDVYCWEGSAEKEDCEKKPTLTISGGHFVSDPSAYVANGYIVTSSDKDGYVYKVVKAPEVDVEVEVEVEPPKADVSNSIPQDKHSEVEQIASSVKTPELAAAGGDVASKLDAQDAQNAKDKLGAAEGQTVVLTVEPYMDITATGYDKDTGAVTLDIEPKYDLVASIEGTDKKETLESARPLDVTTPVTVTVTLASAPAGDGPYYVRHVKDSGEIYYYDLTIKTAGDTTTASFVNPNGFSAFTLPLELAPVTIKFDSGVGARQYTEKDIGEKFPKAQKDGYTFLGWEIKGDLYTKLTAELWDKIEDEKDGVDAVAKFKKSSSGGGAYHPEAGDGSSSKLYDISKPSDVENGSIKVSDSKAEKGETITITVTPDEGYELDKLTVTDEDGDEIDLKDKGDGKFTFEMPKSDVEIEVSFAAVSEVSFADVAPEAWYAEAVQYVVAHGMMNGTSAATFSPDASTTRGMIVTILYRLEGEPAVSAPASFADVAADQYYADAVAWAAQNGIVSGMSATTFAPNNAITREQMAAILYRYAQFKGYDTTQGGMAIREYSDYAQISAYAQQAMAWANASGLITGTSATTLTPAGTATRAQVAAILMRFCENIAK